MTTAAMTTTQAKVTNSGQVSIPATIRRRWDTDAVLVMDCGDYVIVRPLPTDPIAALKGAYARSGPSSEEIRQMERQAEQDREVARRVS